MFSQVTFAHKLSLADVAGERLLRGVRQNVRLESVDASEATLAETADERSESRVNEKVVLEMMTPEKPTMARVAHVPTVVHFRVVVRPGKVGAVVGHRFVVCNAVLTTNAILGIRASLRRQF